MCIRARIPRNTSFGQSLPRLQRHSVLPFFGAEDARASVVPDDGTDSGAPNDSTAACVESLYSSRNCSWGACWGGLPFCIHLFLRSAFVVCGPLFWKLFP